MTVTYIWPHTRPSAWSEFREWLRITALCVVVTVSVLSFVAVSYWGCWLAVAWLWRNA